MMGSRPHTDVVDGGGPQRDAGLCARGTSRRGRRLLPCFAPSPGTRRNRCARHAADRMRQRHHGHYCATRIVDTDEHFHLRDAVANAATEHCPCGVGHIAATRGEGAVRQRPVHGVGVRSGRSSAGRCVGVRRGRLCLPSRPHANPNIGDVEVLRARRCAFRSVQRHLGVVRPAPGNTERCRRRSCRLLV